MNGWMDGWMNGWMDKWVDGLACKIILRVGDAGDASRPPFTRGGTAAFDAEEEDRATADDDAAAGLGGG